jgi:hypothetical protein
VRLFFDGEAVFDLLLPAAAIFTCCLSLFVCSAYLPDNIRI